jgi:acyl carrier protein
MKREEIFEKVVNDILWEGMQLEELGVTFDQLKGETQIVGDNGLGLDSVDTLEVIVKVQSYFGLKIDDVDRDFFLKHLATIDTLVDFIFGCLNESVSE